MGSNQLAFLIYLTNLPNPTKRTGRGSGNWEFLFPATDRKLVSCLLIRYCVDMLLYFIMECLLIPSRWAYKAVSYKFSQTWQQTEGRLLDRTSDKRKELQKSFSACAESRAAIAVEWGQFGNSGKGTFAIRNRYQRTGEGQQTGKTKCVCSERQTVWIGDSAVVKCNNELWESSNSSYQSKPHVSL
jgi:hypothetical protein